MKNKIVGLIYILVLFVAIISIYSSRDVFIASYSGSRGSQVAQSSGAQHILTIRKSGLGSGVVLSRGVNGVDANGNSLISCDSACTQKLFSLDTGKVITIGAQPDQGSTFTATKGWYINGALCSQIHGGTCTVTMDTDITVEAHFDGVGIPPPTTQTINIVARIVSTNSSYSIVTVSNNANCLGTLATPRGNIQVKCVDSRTTISIPNNCPATNAASVDLALQAPSCGSTVEKLPIGSYTLNWNSGYPTSATTNAPVISPSITQTIAADGSITFYIDFLKSKPSDTTAPQLTMLSPYKLSGGGVIYEKTTSGNVLARVSATDSSGIDSVKIQVNCNNKNYLNDGLCTHGSILKAFTGDQATYSIDIPKTLLGPVEVYATACDKNGNCAYDPTTISNGSSGFITLSNPGIIGHIYNIQKASSVTGSYVTIDTYTGKGNSFNIEYPTSGSQAFFRIIDTTATGCTADITNQVVISSPSITSLGTRVNLSGNVTIHACALNSNHIDLYLSGNGSDYQPLGTILGKDGEIKFNTSDYIQGSYDIMAFGYDSPGTGGTILSTQPTVSVEIVNILNPGISKWYKIIATSTTVDSAQATVVKVNSKGQIVVAGNFRDTVQFGVTPDTSRTSLGGLDIFIATFDPMGTLVKVNTYGGSLDDLVYGLAIDSSDNILITGTFTGTSNFGTSATSKITSTLGVYGNDIFVAKYTSTAEPLWSKGLGGRFGGNIGSSIAVDSIGDVIVGGVINGIAGSRDGFLLKLNGVTGGGNNAITSDGYIWEKDFGGSNDDMVRGVAVDSFGDVVVVGYGYGNMNFGGGPQGNFGGSDLFIAKYASTTGTYLWSHVYGGTYPDSAEGVAIDTRINLATGHPYNDIFVTGTYNNTVDLGGTSVTTIVSTNSEAYLAKYYPNGNLQWARGINAETPGGITSRSVAVDSVGNVAIAGSVVGVARFGGTIMTAGSSNFFIAKYGPGSQGVPGAYIWSKRSQNYGPSFGRSIAIDEHINLVSNKPERNVLVTGTIKGYTLFDDLIASTTDSTNTIQDAFLLKISP